MTHRVPLPGGPGGSDMASAWSQRGPAEEGLKETSGWGALGASPSSSEPDLITAYTGHSVDVAQHWETDEACGSEMPGIL